LAAALPEVQSSAQGWPVMRVWPSARKAAERSSMTVDPALFRSHGIDPEYCKIVVVKSPNGFRAAYEPIAKAIFLVDTPGVSTANLRKLPFRRVPRPIYPLDMNTPSPFDN